MLIATPLSSDTSLNDFDILDAVQFIPGASFSFFLRLLQPEKNELRYVADPAATLTVTLPKKDGTDLSVTMTPLTGDFSIWSGSVSSTDSEDLASGNLTFTLDESGTITKGWAENALQLVITGSC